MVRSIRQEEKITLTSMRGQEGVFVHRKRQIQYKEWCGLTVERWIFLQRVLSIIKLSHG